LKRFIGFERGGYGPQTLGDFRVKACIVSQIERIIDESGCHSMIIMVNRES
jgi:hypothetical protein